MNLLLKNYRAVGTTCKALCNSLCIGILTAVLTLLVPQTYFAQVTTVHAPAQTADSSEAPHIGLGISLLPYTFPNNDTYLVQPAGALSWYVPVQFGQHFRCELEFSYAQANDSLLLAFDNNQRIRNYRVSTFARGGVGVYYTHPFDATTRLYAGVRSGLVTSSVTWESFVVGQNMTAPYLYNENIGSFWFGGAVGFEYRFTNHIAIGAEAQLTSYATGAVYSSSPLPSNYPARFPAGRTSDAILTSANVAVRFFF